jgi:hypothetical protein
VRDVSEGVTCRETDSVSAPTGLSVIPGCQGLPKSSAVAYAISLRLLPPYGRVSSRVCVEFVVDKVALDRVLLEELHVLPVSMIPVVLHTHS